MNPQNPLDYRRARQAFVALCQKAGSDSIARVHPWALAPDQKPLFIDSVAFGPRDAKKGLMVMTGRDGRDGALGALVFEALLKDGFTKPADRRLVLVHALNPFGFAWRRHENEDGLALDDARAAKSWSLDMLGAILVEDLARCQTLRVLDIVHGRTDKVVDASDTALAEALNTRRPGLDLKLAKLTLRPANAGFLGRTVIIRALASL